MRVGARLREHTAKDTPCAVVNVDSLFTLYWKERSAEKSFLPGTFVDGEMLQHMQVLLNEHVRVIHTPSASVAQGNGLGNKKHFCTYIHTCIRRTSQLQRRNK